ncbi:MAG TPA: ASCH domain-containing protein [Micrococcales bacterium]|uniref:ASCH domain-containing protein n=1 Tax=Miniimonas arenae TaxID=676201 RepID=A0A5C5BF57_9MICO|nr:ASCH domain-containing protein [Miniimonas arenae]TNU76549.1 ASCH domain-containing protein [Miniimonas arenae]HCX86290.1 ASCH domain-containing protein [Micrococcales bacterium]
MGEDEAIVAYWESVRAKAKVGRLPVVLGPGALAAVPPPAFRFGDAPELADELLRLVLDGVKTATSTAQAELGPDDAAPAAGDLWIALDGAGHPRALLRTTDVVETAFRDVTPAFAEAEGEDDRSLESWRREHERYWRRVLGDDRFDEDMVVLCERFEVLDPA